MVRFMVLVLSLAAPLSAQVAAPPGPATKPSPDELHAQAYQLMLAERFDKASPLLNRAYIETPADQRGRAIILNRATLDLVQKANPMRAIKDLYDYMVRDNAPDEQASNLLGCLLDVAAQTPRLRDGAIYADAFREFARREPQLEQYRPGYKRWGAKWITEAQHDAIKARDRDLERQINERVAELNHVGENIRSTSERYDNAYRTVQGFGNHQHVTRALPSDKPGVTIIQSNECATCLALNEATESANELAAELKALQAKRLRDERRMRELKSRLTKPQWPRRYAPIDPHAPPPKPPETPIPTAAEPATETAPSAPSSQPAEFVR